jgi:acyl-homoserine-lactone acylase
MNEQFCPISNICRPVRKFILLPAFITLSLFLSAQIIPDSVTIVRDNYGVPHIYGATDADVAYGLAWANAEDNFKDMQLNMLMARARLGEAMGKEGAIIDYVVQLIELREVVSSRYPTDVSPQFKKVLEGYCQGINDFVKAFPEKELRPNLTPVTPIDVLCGYTMSLVLLQGAAWEMKSILEGYPGEPGPYSQRGSNSFAMNSRRTADGQVYLLNNSHQPLEGRMSWYEAHLVSGEGQNVHGGLFPGGVSVFAGANANLGWAHTVNLPDLTEVYKLVTRKKGKGFEYQIDGVWKPLIQGKAKMKAKVGGIMVSVSKATFKSEHGPVLQGKKDDFYALRFPALMTIKAAEQWHQMNKASNYTEFRQALELRGLPCMNIVYADRHDTIFYISNGLFPVRKPGFDYKGILPGDRSDLIWNQFRPLSDNVQVLNPQAGYVFNTNNTPFNSTGPSENPTIAQYDSLLGEYYFDNNRSARFQELMAQHPKVDYATFREIKYDRTYPETINVHFLDRPVLLNGLDPAKYPDIADEINALANWDKRGDKESTVATLFNVCQMIMSDEAKEGRYYFQKNVLPDEKYAETIRAAKKYLTKHFGKLDVPLGEFQRHVRGDNDFPIDGLPDVLAAMYTEEWKHGRRKSHTGDSYIQFIRFTETGMEMETAQPYGASEDPKSPHFDDQVEMYLSHKTKPMRLEKAWVMQHAEKVYHPGAKK